MSPPYFDIQPIEVYEVASFYSMFNLKPVGNCVIEVCQTGPCWLNGAEQIVAHFEIPSWDQTRVKQLLMANLP